MLFRSTKLVAARIATGIGADMVIAGSEDIRIIHRIMDGRDLGTFFCADKNERFDLIDFIEHYND